MQKSLKLALLLACLIHAPQALSQTFTGGVSGTVKDPGGAIVPNATVLLTNLDTSEKRTLTTTEEGSFNFTIVPPGRYRVEVEQTGFKKFLQEPIEVRVQQFLNLDVNLEVGQASETVTVTGEVQLIDSTTSSLGHVVENRQITELPLNGRNTLAFVELTPGVRDQGGFGDNPATVNIQAWGNFSANGGLANSNEVLVDGAPVTTVLFHGVGYMPPVDATQEFKVQTNNFSAEFGRTGGAVVNLSIKSGTNDFHGSVYEFLRNDAFDANDFFLNRSGKEKPTLRYHQFGASLGGPLFFPRFGEGMPAFYNGRNRTFFFANYEGFRQREGKAYLARVPTALERAGDFSQTPEIRVVSDPLNRFAPSNRIPSQFLSAAGLRVANALWPLPNTTFVDGNNFATSAVQVSNENQFVTKIDHTINNVWKMFGTYGIQQFDLGGWDPLGNRTTPIDSGRAEKIRTQNAVISATALFSPRLVGDFRVGMTRIAIARIPMSNGFDLTSLGFPASLEREAQVHSFPPIATSGFASLGNSTTSYQLRHNTTISTIGSLSFIREKHTIKVGGQFRALGWNEFSNNGGSPQFTFDGRFTNTQGFGLPSLLLGYPSSGFITNSDYLSLMRKYVALYVQDDWKVNNKLTLNLGLEWSVDTPYTERYNKQSWFDPQALPPMASVIPQISFPQLGGGTVTRPVNGSLRFASEEDRHADDIFWKQFGPRVGFAYQLFDKTVARGGYGIYWLPSTAYWRTAAPTYFRTRQNYVASLDNGRTPAPGISLSNPFPNGVFPAPGNSPVWDRYVTSISQDSVTVGDQHPGYMQNWNLNLQQDLGRGMAFDIAYAGSKGTGLPGYLNINQLGPEHLANLTPERIAYLNRSVRNPFRNPDGSLYVRTGPLSTENVSVAQLLRPFPQYDQVILGPQNIGNSSYHSMQLKFMKRFSASLIGTTYTWSKTIDDTIGTVTAFAEEAGQPSVTDTYNLKSEKSLSAFDIPHRFTVSYTVELPWKDGSGVLGRVVSGWEATGIYTLQSGTPIFLTTPGTNNLFALAHRPNSLGRDASIEGRAQDRLSRWFDTSAFAAPAPYTFGNVSRTLPNVRTHHTNNLDAGFFKNNRFGTDGRYNVQLRFEAFNVMNRARFGYPARSCTDAAGEPGLDCRGTQNFGVVSSQANKPRNIQMAIKFLF
jgi:hypothetical protein